MHGLSEVNVDRSVCWDNNPPKKTSLHFTRLLSKQHWSTYTILVVDDAGVVDALALPQEEPRRTGRCQQLQGMGRYCHLYRQIELVETTHPLSCVLLIIHCCLYIYR